MMKMSNVCVFVKDENEVGESGLYSELSERLVIVFTLNFVCMFVLFLLVFQNENLKCQASLVGKCLGMLGIRLRV